MKIVLVPIDNTKKARETKWICVCPTCQCERVITYSQSWNIKTGKNKHGASCSNCRPEPICYLPKKVSKEAQAKSAQTRKGQKNKSATTRLEFEHLFKVGPQYTKEGREKYRKAKLGKRGSETNRWDGGKTSERKLSLNRDDYKQLRKYVFKRDNFTCQICFKRGIKLEMDHIKEWCNYPELRYEPTNCRTLCKECHTKTDNYGTKAIGKKCP